MSPELLMHFFLARTQRLNSLVFSQVLSTKIGARTTVGYGDFAEKSEDEITEIITCKLSTCRK